MMEKKNRVKIFVSYHKEGEILKSEIMTPIHVGAALSKIELDMQRDDEGDNISKKNEKFCELTAQYWAWKNAEADYYGFMHYRRHFVFEDIPDVVEYSGVTIQKRIDEDYKQKIGLYDGKIYDCIDGYDVILPVVVDASSWGTLSNEVQFSTLDNLHAVDFHLTCQTILELYPEYEKAVTEFRNGKYAYWYNMFIMKKEIFFDYCQWLFSILKRAEEKIDFTYFSEQEMRTLAFMAERLLSIYMIKLLEDKPELKVKHLKITFVNDTDKQQDIQPAFEKNNVAIAVSCNEKYMPILGVMLSTLLKNGSEENNYDILVLCNKSEFTGDGIARNIKLLKKLVNKYSNASFRLVDISRSIGSKKFFVRGNFTPETYFRLFLPQILRSYEKVLYLDADMIVCRDVAELYKEDLEGALLGAVRDPIISGSNKCPMYNQHDYMIELGIKNIYDYFQAGVLLLDLKKMAEDDLCDKMIEFAATHECDLVDQDVLNLFCQGRVKFIDNRWNVDVNNIAMKAVPYAPAAMWKQYVKNRERAYIYHFAGADKPWKIPSLDKAEIFWEAARETSWYEMLLKELMEHSVFVPKQTVDTGREMDSSPLIRAHAELASLGLSKSLFEVFKNEKNKYQSMISGKHVIFYGGGNCCRQILLYMDKLGLDYPEEIWDRAAKPGKRLFGVPVHRPNFESLRNRDDVLAFITIESKVVSEAVRKSFAEYGFNNIIEEKELMEILAKSLWIKLEEENESTSS